MFAIMFFFSLRRERKVSPLKHAHKHSAPPPASSPDLLERVGLRLVGSGGFIYIAVRYKSSNGSRGRLIKLRSLSGSVRNYGRKLAPAAMLPECAIRFSVTDRDKRTRGVEQLFRILSTQNNYTNVHIHIHTDTEIRGERTSEHVVPSNTRLTRPRNAPEYFGDFGRYSLHFFC